MFKCQFLEHFPGCTDSGASVAEPSSQSKKVYGRRGLCRDDVVDSVRSSQSKKASGRGGLCRDEAADSVGSSQSKKVSGRRGLCGGGSGSGGGLCRPRDVIVNEKKVGIWWLLVSRARCSCCCC